MNRRLFFSSLFPFCRFLFPPSYVFFPTTSTSPSFHAVTSASTATWVERQLRRKVTQACGGRGRRTFAPLKPTTIYSCHPMRETHTAIRQRHERPRGAPAWGPERSHEGIQCLLNGAASRSRARGRLPERHQAGLGVGGLVLLLLLPGRPAQRPPSACPSISHQSLQSFELGGGGCAVLRHVYHCVLLQPCKGPPQERLTGSGVRRG